jgi:hypothetical protein
MKSRSCVFNGFLALAVLAFAAGCCTSEECKRSKEMSTLRVHVESDRGSNDRASAISVIRSSPIRINIEREPVLDERNVVGARIVEEEGGLFSIEIQLDRRGSWALERTTVANRGKRLAIFSAFDKEARWLAAYVIPAKNSSGRLTFTPDASHEEAERFVRGLNNFAKDQENSDKWPFAPAMER